MAKGHIVGLSPCIYYVSHLDEALVNAQMPVCHPAILPFREIATTSSVRSNNGLEIG